MIPNFTSTYICRWWWVVILASVVAFFLMASGNTMLEEENSENQWVPKNHPYIKNDAWLRMNKPKSKVGINEKGS